MLERCNVKNVPLPFASHLVCNNHSIIQFFALTPGSFKRSSLELSPTSCLPVTSNNCSCSARWHTPLFSTLHLPLESVFPPAASTEKPCKFPWSDVHTEATGTFLCTPRRLSMHHKREGTPTHREHSPLDQLSDMMIPRRSGTSTTPQSCAFFCIKKPPVSVEPFAHLSRRQELAASVPPHVSGLLRSASFCLKFAVGNHTTAFSCQCYCYCSCSCSCQCVALLWLLVLCVCAGSWAHYFAPAGTLDWAMLHAHHKLAIRFHVSMAL